MLCKLASKDDLLLLIPFFVFEICLVIVQVFGPLSTLTGLGLVISSSESVSRSYKFSGHGRLTYDSSISSSIGSASGASAGPDSSISVASKADANDMGVAIVEVERGRGISLPGLTGLVAMGVGDGGRDL
jgi:hypothetical protein